MARTKLQNYFLAAGFVFFSFFTGLLYNVIATETHNHETCIFNVRIGVVVRVILSITTLCLAVMCFHISYIRASKSHTLFSILLLYILSHIVNLFSILIWRQFDARAKDPRRAQEDFLKSLMKRDANTAYGKRNNFSNIKCLEDLRKLHPLTTYDHYEQYIERMANGEKNVLLCEKLSRFGVTSGTTGKGKLVPLTRKRYTSIFTIQLILQDVISKKYGYKSPLQKDFGLYVNPRPTTTPGGDIIGPMHLYTDGMKTLVTAMGNTPWEVMSVSTEYEAHYLELLFNLYDSNIGTWIGPFSSQIHKAISRVETHWKQFVHDIKTGAIDKDLQIPIEVREACEKALSPDPERAEELRKEFEQGFDGIVRRIWPHMKCVFGINTAQFTEKLNKKYTKGIPIVSGTYLSTEGDYGVNMWADEDKYALIPSATIYEFIPEENINEAEPKTLFLDEVKIGDAYEMVVSTMCGFYRYRFGDVIKVVDFYYNLPVIKFMYRSGQLLNLRSEKVTELSVDDAVHHMVNNMTGAKLAYWTSAENTLLAGTKDVEYKEGSQFYLVLSNWRRRRIVTLNLMMNTDKSLTKLYRNVITTTGVTEKQRPFLYHTSTSSNQVHSKNYRIISSLIPRHLLTSSNYHVNLKLRVH
ncbi:uncharacterized protein [Amphiura filiformis]|uniref:uncharacterized protein n=1 Tax=Amphiura filiformis TaxID=82378 RepID=UPI003B20D405